MKKLQIILIAFVPVFTLTSYFLFFHNSYPESIEELLNEKNEWYFQDINEIISDSNFTYYEKDKFLIEIMPNLSQDVISNLILSPYTTKIHFYGFIDILNDNNKIALIDTKKIEDVQLNKLTSNTKNVDIFISTYEYIKTNKQLLNEYQSRLINFANLNETFLYYLVKNDIKDREFNAALLDSLSSDNINKLLEFTENEQFIDLYFANAKKNSINLKAILNNNYPIASKYCENIYLTVLLESLVEPAFIENYFESESCRSTVQICIINTSTDFSECELGNSVTYSQCVQGKIDINNLRIMSIRDLANYKFTFINLSEVCTAAFPNELKINFSVNYPGNNTIEFYSISSEESELLTYKSIQVATSVNF